MIYRLEDTKKTASLWKDWQETLIWSCMQGVMGSIYVNDLEHPVSAMAVLGDFCFLAGKPDREFILYKYSCGEPGSECGTDKHFCGEPDSASDSDKHTCNEQEFMIMVPQNAEWARMIEECLGSNAKRVVRYAIKKEPDIFDQKKLRAYADKLPDGYVLKMIDEKLYRWCGETAWCRDFVAQYADYDLYRKYGLGVVALKDGVPVSGASSYSGYIGGIEIEIDTREDYRRKGLACACGAKLILECLERGLYPSWDAQNKWSVALAEKLGYHFDCEYTAYEVTCEV